jgi:hypothetical protein
MTGEAPPHDASEESILIVQGNLAITYGDLGDQEKALSMERDVYSGHLKLKGEEHPDTLREAVNYASTLIALERFEEVKPRMLQMMPVVRRVLGESNDLAIIIRWNYARALYEDPAATHGDLREAVNTLEETERTARRVLGGAHPITEGIDESLQDARDALHARGLP